VVWNRATQTLIDLVLSASIYVLFRIKNAPEVYCQLTGEKAPPVILESMVQAPLVTPVKVKKTAEERELQRILSPVVIIRRLSPRILISPPQMEVEDEVTGPFNPRVVVTPPPMEVDDDDDGSEPLVTPPQIFGDKDSGSEPQVTPPPLEEMEPLASILTPPPPHDSNGPSSDAGSTYSLPPPPPIFRNDTVKSTGSISDMPLPPPVTTQFSLHLYSDDSVDHPPTPSDLLPLPVSREVSVGSIGLEPEDLDRAMRMSPIREEDETEATQPTQLLPGVNPAPPPEDEPFFSEDSWLMSPPKELFSPAKRMRSSSASPRAAKKPRFVRAASASPEKVRRSPPRDVALPPIVVQKRKPLSAEAKEDILNAGEVSSEGSVYLPSDHEEEGAAAPRTRRGKAKAFVRQTVDALDQGEVVDRPPAVVREPSRTRAEGACQPSDQIRYI